MNQNNNETCICCGKEFSYNRRIEQDDTREVIGGLCGACETARFGNTLRSLDGSNASGCVYCQDRPSYVVPEHTVILDDGGGSECEISGYFVSETTPRLCHAHLDMLRLDSQTFWPDKSPMVEASD